MPAGNAVSATIAQARKLAAAPATAKVPVTLAQVAAQAGYPGKAASPVRALYRRNGHGAQANGQTRYAPCLPAQLVLALTTTHAALASNASKAVVAKARGAQVHRIALGAKAAKAGAAQAKGRGKAKAKAAPQVPALAATQAS